MMVTQMRTNSYEVAGNAASANLSSIGDDRMKIFVQIIAGVVLFLLVGAFLITYDDPETTVVIVDVAEEPADVEVVKLPFDFQKSCTANSIVVQSLVACVLHPKCSLTIDETSVMYHAGKTSIIDCKTAELVRKFAEELQMQKRQPYIYPRQDEDEVIKI